MTMTNNTLKLTDTIKLFGLTRTSNIIHDKDTLNLVNWTLTTARCAIHKSAVNYRTKQIITSPQELFAALLRHILNLSTNAQSYNIMRKHLLLHGAGALP